MTTLRLSKVVERPTEYELEVEVVDAEDCHRIGCMVAKPITLAKVKAAIREVYLNSPGPGNPLRTAYWEGKEVTL